MLCLISSMNRLFVNRFHWLSLLGGVFLIFGLMSCSKAAKKVFEFVTKDAIEEAVEEGAEAAAKKSAKLLLKEGGEEGSKQGAKQVTKEVAQKGSEVAVRELAEDEVKVAGRRTALNTAKSVSSEVIELTVDQLPRGAKVLEVLPSKGGGFVPVLNNLGDNAARYTSLTNRRLLAVRRKAISPYNQYATLDQLRRLSPKNYVAGEKASSSKLLNNLLEAMDPNQRGVANAFGGHAAHHIVEGTDPAAKGSREILDRFKIGINSAENGMLLPTDVNSIYKGAIHTTSHSKAYSEYVYSQLKDCKTRDEVIVKLTEIKSHIYNGKLNLQGINQVYNRNLPL